MKRLRTTLIIYLTTLLWSLVSVESYGIGSKSKNLQNNLYQVLNVTQSDEIESMELITYHPINQPSDSAGLIFDVTLKNRKILSKKDAILLISTISENSCESKLNILTLPAWKIDTHWKKFRLKINLKTTQDFAGSTLFLCVYNEHLGQMQHLGEFSALKIFNKNHLPSNDAVDER